MATRKKKATAELLAQPDPTAPLDGQQLLNQAKGALELLGKDLLARADGSAGLTAALQARHAKEVEQKRTAMQYAEWRRSFVDQVAAAWFLSVVFVRTLEDRGLLERNRIAGAGALDSQRAFFALAPSLNERDYLLAVFRELTHLPAAAALFDARHNPVWLLAPSAAAAQALLELFRSPHAETPAFRFGGDSRFLGDLYQDLNADVRSRYALLQTPRFVESFILDRTLTPAIERFGLDDTRLIDPTCGSGHFLLGAFERLFERRLAEEPGLGHRQAAHRALDAVAGTDINPYAVAIARFRLTLAFLEKGDYAKLKDAPKLPLHLAVADSLLHNDQRKTAGAAKSSEGYVQKSLGELETTSRVDWEGGMFGLDDPAATKDVLGQRYAAVVGNPPYITVKDAALRDVYRAMYEKSAAGKYSLAAPFCERFFQLGREGGSVGMITANSFMKREFGKKLIQEYLPSVNLEAVINTSGAYIPGHGTPTVLLFGTAEEPRAGDLLTVLASRGEPSTPEDPERGEVWSSIAQHSGDVGFENEYISVTRTARDQLAKHPWSLGGGGATELKELLEERAGGRLGEVATAIGFDAIMGEDELFFGSQDWLRRLGVDESQTRILVEGEVVRDWSINSATAVVFPYGTDLLPAMPRSPGARQHFWRYRVPLIHRRQFGKNTIEAGLQWFEYRSFYKSKRSTPLSITFAFVATHNHFVLDRGGKVFKQTAPIIKLPESATEDDHYALLAYLNSSTACFWMKQVMMNKGATSDRGVLQPDLDKFRFEFDGTKLKSLPLPRGWDSTVMTSLGRKLSDLAADRNEAVFDGCMRAHDGTPELEQKLGALEEALEENRDLSVALQEELDWHVYGLFRLTELEQQYKSEAVEPYAADERPFVAPDKQPAGSAREHRAREIAENALVGLIERAEYKRRWYTPHAQFNAEAVTPRILRERAQERYALEQVENISCKQTTAFIPSGLGRPTFFLKGLAEASVPYLSALRFTESGMEKFRAWERTWELQRREDRGENVGDIPVPPKYDSKDFRDGRYWSLRGKLDVPKERFISYPGCESDQDGEPLYGWAGWNHLQRAVALAELYNGRKLEEGWQADRLTPLLAGLLELLPWLEQWHGEPDASLDGGIPAEQFRQFLDGECTELGLTHEELRAWRPAARSGRVAKKGGRKQKAEVA